MRNNILTIMGKEFTRFFGDRRMLLSLLLPGILIYILYSFMGTALADMFTPEEDYLSSVYIENMPASLTDESMSLWSWAEIQNNDTNSVEIFKDMVRDKQLDLVIIFPIDFDEAVETYDVKQSGVDAPNIEIYYNGSQMSSSNAYMYINSILEAYETSLSNKFDINRDIIGSNLATDKDTSATLISLIMPMLITMLLFSGCTSIATESIAGEKERGTLGTLLVSPLKRSELALGKILSLSVLSFLIGVVTSISTIFSLPKLMGTSETINVNIYSTKDYLLLALVILTTLLLQVSLVSIISAFAKSVKEAGTSIMPLMIVVMVIGVTGMFSSSKQQPLLYLIPIYNSVHCMSGIFAFEYSPLNILITIVSNIVLVVTAGFILTKMFNSEKIVFSK